jgi:hypothetical protein
MSTENSRILPIAEIHQQDSEGAYSATLQTVKPVDGEMSGSVVFIPGHLAGSDSFAHHIDGVIEEVLDTPYGVNIWTFNTRYTPHGRSIGHRVDQTSAVLKHVRNHGGGKTVVVSHSEGNHVALGTLMYQQDLLKEVGGVIGLGMVSVNAFPGTEHQEVSIADLAAPHNGEEPAINVPLLGFARAIVEDTVEHLPALIRESHTAGLISKIAGTAGRLGLHTILPEQAHHSKVPLVPLAGAGIGEVVEMLPYATVNPDARKALITLLSNVMKLSVGSNPFGEGHQILTTPTAELSAILSELVPVTHISGTRDRLAVGSIKEGLESAGFKGDIHEYDMGHLELLFRRPVVRRAASIAVNYMFSKNPETELVDHGQFDMTPADRGLEFIVREGVRSLRRRLGTAA